MGVKLLIVFLVGALATAQGRTLLQSFGSDAIGLATPFGLGGSVQQASDRVTESFNPPPAVTNERYEAPTNERNSNRNNDPIGNSGSNSPSNSQNTPEGENSQGCERTCYCTHVRGGAITDGDENAVKTSGQPVSYCCTADVPQACLSG